jgi:aspartokinase-like uncharacterized kinase
MFKDNTPVEEVVVAKTAAVAPKRSKEVLDAVDVVTRELSDIPGGDNISNHIRALLEV